MTLYRHKLVFNLLILTILFSGCIPQTQSTQVFPSTSTAPAAASHFALQNPASIPAPSYPEDVIRLAWFYKPPENESPATLAKYFDTFILTHKDETVRDRLVGLGANHPIYQYLLFVEIQDPGSCDKEPWGNQVAYKTGDFCQISEQHPDWFLLDIYGDRIINGDNYYMDPGNKEYQAFWLERALEMQAVFGWEALFIDNVEASLNKLDRLGPELALYPTESYYQKAIEDFLGFVQQNYSQAHRRSVLANIIESEDASVWLGYLEYIDGAMIESFAFNWHNGYLPAPEWEAELQMVEQALEGGKTLILVTQGEKLDTQRQYFGFASYLLIANGNAYFRYSGSDFYEEVWLYDNYIRELGAPLGSRYRSGTAWKRDFANGRVTVNHWTHFAEITYNE